MRLVSTMIMTLCLLSAAGAQQATPPADPPAAPANGAAQPATAAREPDGTRARQPNPRRVLCMDNARQRGLRGQQLRDSIALCVEEARLACTKKAIEQKIAGPQRRDFLKNCTG